MVPTTWTFWTRTLTVVLLRSGFTVAKLRTVEGGCPSFVGAFSTTMGFFTGSFIERTTSTRSPGLTSVPTPETWSTWTEMAPRPASRSWLTSTRDAAALNVEVET
jgi:hypothetical protein